MLFLVVSGLKEEDHRGRRSCLSSVSVIVVATKQTKTTAENTEESWILPTNISPRGKAHIPGARNLRANVYTSVTLLLLIPSGPPDYGVVPHIQGTSCFLTLL